MNRPEKSQAPYGVPLFRLPKSTPRIAGPAKRAPRPGSLNGRMPNTIAKMLRISQNRQFFAIASMNAKVAINSPSKTFLRYFTRPSIIFCAVRDASPSLARKVYNNVPERTAAAMLK